MKFFISGEEIANNPEQIYQQIKTNAQSQLGGKISERRIFSIECIENKTGYEFKVGNNANFHEVKDIIIAIYEWGDSYLVYTPSRGVDPRLPMPIIIPKSNTARVEDFDG